VLAGGECYYCGWPATEVDHIIPGSRGGGHEDENLVPACSRCDLQKGAHTPEEWAASRLAAGKPWPSAETREEAITKASAEVGAINSGYIPEQKYVRALLENLHEMSEDGDVVIHWDAIRQRS
jgi:hypothetical protein